MRRLSMVLTASAAATLFATAADAGPSIGSTSHRAGGEASAKADDGVSLFDAIAALIGFSATAKVTPVAGSESPRTAAPRMEECEEDKKRADAAKAAETRRTAEAEKRSRGSEPVYLAF